MPRGPAEAVAVVVVVVAVARAKPKSPRLFASDREAAAKPGPDPKLACERRACSPRASLLETPAHVAMVALCVRCHAPPAPALPSERNARFWRCPRDEMIF